MNKLVFNFKIIYGIIKLGICALSCFGRYYAIYQTMWFKIENKIYGRLAQLVERNIDVVDARGSSPLPPTA